AADLPEDAVLAQAFEAARILAHMQGFAILSAASEAFDWALDLARIAEIWRAGCIIRSGLLDDLAVALREAPDAPLLLAPGMAARLEATVPALRQVVGAAVAAGVPIPAMSATLAWFDSMRQGRGTANLIQGQRDFFGAHGFRRVDREGDHHGPWGG
ncbi:MAG: NADP-dependent phosphogluconate dehydrogenase, partial [Rhodobacteraceae bacterium]|nr:NADP-dependent phosphogluconate dehydrogenase [Paracoccaceae bacterium]